MTYLMSGNARKILMEVKFNIHFNCAVYKNTQKFHLTLVQGECIIWTVSTFDKTEPTDQVNNKKNSCLRLAEYCTAASCWLCWFQSVASWTAACAPHGEHVSEDKELNKQAAFYHLKDILY